MCVTGNGRGVRFSEEEVQSSAAPAPNGDVEMGHKSALNDEMQLKRRTYNVHKMHTAVKVTTTSLFNTRFHHLDFS